MRRLLLLILSGLLFFSCGKNKDTHIDYKDVFIYYGSGYNNLSSSLSGNISTLKRGTYIPDRKDDKAMVVYCQNTFSSSNYNTPNVSHLVWIYKSDSRVICDTLKTYPATLNSATTECLSTVLNDIDAKFKSESYGLLVSSHATGHLPSRYLYSDEYKSINNRPWSTALSAFEEEQQYNYPLTKTICAYFDKAPSNSIEMEIEDFAKAIPFKLEYLIFDACLMGGIEPAWALKDVCDYMIASPCEVLSQGMDYNTLASRLLGGTYPDYTSVCTDYYNLYISQPDEISKSATISLYDMSKIGAVKDSYSAILKAHADSYTALQEKDNTSRKSIQGYFYRETYPKQYFYDIRDLASVMGASEEQLADLDVALDNFVEYHLETPSFFGTALSRCSGLSVYLPRNDWSNLNNSYKGLSWSQAVNALK